MHGSRSRPPLHISGLGFDLSLSLGLDLGLGGQSKLKVAKCFSVYVRMSLFLSVTLHKNSYNSALGLDRDLGFSRGPPPGTPR